MQFTTWFLKVCSIYNLDKGQVAIFWHGRDCKIPCNFLLSHFYFTPISHYTHEGIGILVLIGFTKQRICHGLMALLYSVVILYFKSLSLVNRVRKWRVYYFRQSSMNSVTEKLIVSSELLIDLAPGVLYKTYGARFKQLSRTEHRGHLASFWKEPLKVIPLQLQYRWFSLHYFTEY